MNDRFRFRAFHKKGYMFEVSKIDLANGKLLGVQHVRYDIIEDVTLMQCTGLKDKNGKLIYENDVLHNSNSGTKTRMTWDDNAACFYIAPINSDHFWIGGWEAIEIIGNIYENPELLK